MRIEVRDGRGGGGLGARGLTGEVDLWFDLREGEGHGAGIAESGERVDPRAAGVAEAEEFGDLVEGFAGGIVDGAADERVAPRRVDGAGEIEMGVTAGDDEGKGWVGMRSCRSQVSEARPFGTLRAGFGASSIPVSKSRPGAPERLLARHSRLALVEEDGVDVAF